MAASCPASVSRRVPPLRQCCRARLLSPFNLSPSVPQPARATVGGMNHRYEIEGHTVWLLGEGPYRRFFCDCEVFKESRGGPASCRFTYRSLRANWPAVR